MLRPGPSSQTTTPLLGKVQRRQSTIIYSAAQWPPVPSEMVFPSIMDAQILHYNHHYHHHHYSPHRCVPENLSTIPRQHTQNRWLSRKTHSIFTPTASTASKPRKFPETVRNLPQLAELGSLPTAPKKLPNTHCNSLCTMSLNLPNCYSCCCCLWMRFRTGA